MGVSRSGTEFARKLNRLTNGFEDISLEVVKESSFVVKKAVLGFLKPATGGDQRLSGVGRTKRGAYLGVRYNVGNYSGEAKSLIYVTGPFQLIERDTKAGVRPIRRRRLGRKRAGREYGVTMGYYHPGTKGKHPFAHGVDAATPAVTRLLQSKSTLLLRRVL